MARIPARSPIRSASSSSPDADGRRTIFSIRLRSSSEASSDPSPLNAAMLDETLACLKELYDVGESDIHRKKSFRSYVRLRFCWPRVLAWAKLCVAWVVTSVTYYRWRKEYGGMKVDQAKRLKDLEKENARLKRLLADAELDKAILKEAASGNF